MNVLVVGNGGREHALAWKVAQSPLAETIYIAPGNAGTANEPKCQNVAIDATDIDTLLTFAKEHSIDLTIVGPEAPLALGIVDRFQQANMACFGPSQNAAQLESSKAFSKSFMQKYAIPTANYQRFDSLEPALDYIQQQTFPLVIKADGLAAGKGVIIAENHEQAKQALSEILVDRRYGEAGSRVIIEEFLDGEEASFIIITDGKSFIPLATSQDHKRRDEGDLGPNTGGMGAYSPAPVIDQTTELTIINEVIKPTLNGLAQEGIPYCGFLYAGLMINAQGQPKVLEFNCRLGDPETQPIMMRLQSDLLKLCLSAYQGSLSSQDIQWDERCALGIVLASKGYPNQYSRGHRISGLEQNLPQHSKVFHAGTQLQQGHAINDGGRVLCVTTLADTIALAQNQAYPICANIAWDGGVQYRKDIGHRALSHASKE